MIPVFVAGTELKMAVQEEADIVLEPSENNVLIVRVTGEDDLVRIDVVFRGLGDMFGSGKPCAESARGR